MARQANKHCGPQNKQAGRNYAKRPARRPTLLTQLMGQQFSLMRTKGWLHPGSLVTSLKVKTSHCASLRARLLKKRTPKACWLR